MYPFPLQKIQSSEEELLLRSVDLDTTGLYRCEISGEAPLFQTASREAVLAVVGKFPKVNKVRFDIPYLKKMLTHYTQKTFLLP